MYKLISINESAVTRTVDLKSINTGMVNTCFDDSALVSIDNNFDFMEIGKEYKCKVKLFGHIVERKSQTGVECTILEKNIKVGNTLLVEVSVDNDIYYIYQEKVASYLSEEKFTFEFTRKDLIQVDDIVHDDLLG